MNLRKLFSFYQPTLGAGRMLEDERLLRCSTCEALMA